MTFTAPSFTLKTLADVVDAVLKHRRGKAFSSWSDDQVRAELCRAHLQRELHVFPSGIVIATCSPEQIHVKAILSFTPDFFKEVCEFMRLQFPHKPRITGYRRGNFLDFTDKIYG